MRGSPHRPVRSSCGGKPPTSWGWAGRAEGELRLERARLLQSGERSAALRGGGTAFDSLRDYRPDDEFRRINWRATARAARPISNDYREERNQQVILMLDAGRTMAP